MALTLPMVSAVEGYVGPVAPLQAAFPVAVQASFIPRDSAAATTANPQLAKPDYRDWTDARDSFNYFLEIYSPATVRQVTDVPRADIDAMFLEAPKYVRQIEDFILNPETTPSRDLLERGFEAQRLANAIRQVGPADPLSVGWERPGCISHVNDNLMA